MAILSISLLTKKDLLWEGKSSYKSRYVKRTNNLVTALSLRDTVVMMEVDDVLFHAFAKVVNKTSDASNF